jgi:hypothetical protein
MFALGELAFGAWLIKVASEDDALLAGVAFALFVAMGPAVLALRYALRARIVAMDEALVVVGCLSRREIPWSEVVGADPGYSGITVHLRDGSSVVAGAVQKANVSVWLGRPTRADEVAGFIRERALPPSPTGQ